MGTGREWEEMSTVESWRSPDVLGHKFRGHISDEDLSMDPREVVERVKEKLIASIVERLMKKLGPKLDQAIETAWRDTDGD